MNSSRAEPLVCATGSMFTACCQGNFFYNVGFIPAHVKLMQECHKCTNTACSLTVADVVKNVKDTFKCWRNFQKIQDILKEKNMILLEQRFVRENVLILFPAVTLRITVKWEELVLFPPADAVTSISSWIIAVTFRAQKHIKKRKRKKADLQAWVTEKLLDDSRLSTL